MDIERTRKLIELHEGRKSRPYLDSTGHWTIGVGRNISPTGPGFTQAEIVVLTRNRLDSVRWHPLHQSFCTPYRGLELSEWEIDFLLNNDLARVSNELARHLPFFAALEEPRQAVLIDMGFNMGIPILMGFTQTLPAIARREFHTANLFMLRSKWADQVGKKPGQRAWRDAEMMLRGEWVDV